MPKGRKRSQDEAIRGIVTTSDGRKVALPIVEKDPRNFYGYVRLAGWVGQQYMSLIVPRERVEVV